MHETKETKGEMAITPNYHLHLPSLDDEADITKLNENFEKIDKVLKQNESDTTVTEKIEQINTKIGEPTDDHTKQTVFGKIAGVLKKVIGIDDKVGTAADTAAQATLFGKIKGITDNVSGNLKPINDKIGQPADNETTQTVFGKIADLKKVIMEKLEVIHSYVTNVDSLAKQIQVVIGKSTHDNNIHSLFGRLKIVQNANDMTNSRIGTSSDSSSSNTLFGKIANINYKLSGMSVVRKITRGVGVGQIDRYDNVEDFVVNVSISNTNKVVVIINNHFIGRSAYRQGTGNASESLSIFGAYTKEITNSKVVMSPAYSSASGEKTGETFEYCIVEFY